MSIAQRFCSACGNAIIESAVICPACGSPTPKFQNSRRGSAQKSKTTAVLLAVFLGAWSFLYLYKKDALKFWISICLLVPFWFFTTFFLSTLGVSVGADGRVSDWVIWVANNLIIFFTLWCFILVGTWFWAIVVQATRSHSTFEDPS
jgi:uncharacterized membrane protein